MTGDLVNENNRKELKSWKTSKNITLLSERLSDAILRVVT